jgi:hypothetical protein
MKIPMTDDGLATGLYFDTYFGEDKERHYKNKDWEKLASQITIHSFLFNSLAGSILQ